MKTVQTILAALLSFAIIAAPQLSTVIKPEWQIYFYTALTVYELLVRWMPTTVNISLLSQFVKLLQLLAPNNSTTVKNYE